MSRTALLSRRNLLHATGGLFIGSATLGPGLLTNTHAQETQASLIFNNQQTDGQSLLIAHAQTSVDARLIIVTGKNKVFRVLRLDAGTTLTNRALDLQTPIEKTQTIRAELRTADDTDRLLARDWATITVGESAQPPEFRIVTPDRDAEFHYPYFLFTPPTLPKDSERTLLVQGNNSPRATDDYNAHRNRARIVIGKLAKNLARPLQVPALVPAFPRPKSDPVPWDVAIQALDDSALTTEHPRLERVDKQLLSMISDARQRLENEGYQIRDKIHMHGFSASATFANRFTILHPTTVAAVSCGGNGAYVLPKKQFKGKTLPYPIGVANLEELVGKPFNKQAWTNVEQYLYVGGDDQPLPETNPRKYRGFNFLSAEKKRLALEIFGQNRVTERFPVTKSVYKESGASATFTIYDGVGHRTTEFGYKDLRSFHGSTKGIGTSIGGISIPRDPTVILPAIIGGAVAMFVGISFISRLFEE